MSYSFLDFKDSISSFMPDVSLPIGGKASATAVVGGFVDADISSVSFVTENNSSLPINNSGVFRSGNYFTLHGVAFTLLTVGTCFYIKLNTNLGFRYSTKLHISSPADSDKFSIIEYRCNEDAFGFSYASNEFYNIICLPVRLHKAQFPQADKIYQKLNGERKVLFSKIDKEYELETDYMPIDWHEKMIVALSHDHVKVNSNTLTKTSDYQIDYENEEITNTGVLLVKGNCKVSTNLTLHNSNCK